MNEPAPSLKRSLQANAHSDGGPPMKVRRIMSSLPQRMLKPLMIDTTNAENDAGATTKTDSSSMSPQDYLVSLVESQGGVVRISPSLTTEGFFVDPTEAEINAYTNDVVSAVRTRNLDKLKELHANGHSLKCSNRFGESLLHMACRRGFVDVVELLVNEVNTPLNIRDDYGRTPAHDVCWTVEPNFELLKLILNECPSLFFMSDKRGNTPLEYARPEHYKAYRDFLKQHEHLLPLATKDGEQVIRKQ